MKKKLVEIVDEGTSGLSVTGAMDVPKEKVYNVLSNKLKRFYRDRNCNFESQKFELKVMCPIYRQGEKILDILIEYEGSQREEDMKAKGAGDEIFYLRENFYAELIAPNNAFGTAERDHFLRWCK